MEDKEKLKRCLEYYPFEEKFLSGNEIVKSDRIARVRIQSGTKCRLCGRHICLGESVRRIVVSDGIETAGKHRVYVWCAECCIAMSESLKQDSGQVEYRKWQGKAKDYRKYNVLKMSTEPLAKGLVVSADVKWIPDPARHVRRLRPDGTKRFILTESFMDKSFESAVQAIRDRAPGVKWEHCGAFMDTVAMHAYLTKEQADTAGLDWESYTWE